MQQERLQEFLLTVLWSSQFPMAMAVNSKSLWCSEAAVQRPAAAGELAQGKSSTHPSRDTTASN
jgi:hypothetical protein